MSRILYIQYTNPGGYPPLQHSSTILAEAGWCVMFLGTGALGSNSLAFPSHRNIIVRKMEFCCAGWRQKVHFLKYCVWVLWTVLVWRPDWIYASDPFSCPVGCLLNWMPGLRVLYHEHDSPATDSAPSVFLRFTARARRYLARRATVCVLPNARRLERFDRECGPLRNAVCVWNCPAESDILPCPRSAAGESLWILYHGSIVPERLPMPVLTALADLPSHVHLRVAGYETAGSRGYTARLRGRAEELGITGRVEFLNAIPQRADLMEATSRSDIGLALMPLATTDFNCETMTGASNKAFDYLGCGLALMVSDLPDWRAMFVDAGYAIGCDPGDPGSIAAALRVLIGNPARMRAMGEAGRRRILDSWNYEAAFRPVFEILSAHRTSAFPVSMSRPLAEVGHRKDAR